MATIKQTFTLTVNPAPLAFVTPPTLPAVPQGQPANIPIVVEGGTPPDAFSVSNGSLPAGMSLDPVAGVLSGTPTASGTSTFEITVTDSGS
jgi:hypothetical protein